jgi:methyltransferase (TIGR00027 family)
MRQHQASRTAQHNALFRALEARRPRDVRIADDHLAPALLPLEFKLVAAIAKVPPARRAIERVIDRRWPGPRMGVVVRTRVFDDAICRSLPGSEQVLMLGAGLDSRAYRLPGIDAVRVFEVDHPATQRFKRERIVRIRRSVPAHVTFVPVDFGTDDLMASLTRNGFRSPARTLVVWDGVTNYLTPTAVDQTFATLADALEPGSPVFFTYIDRSMIDGTGEFAGAHESRTHVERVGEPYTFGFDPPGLAAYLAERGFDLMWDEAVSDAARAFNNGRAPVGYAYYHMVEARRRHDAAR